MCERLGCDRDEKSPLDLVELFPGGAYPRPRLGEVGSGPLQDGDGGEFGLGESAAEGVLAAVAAIRPSGQPPAVREIAEGRACPAFPLPLNGQPSQNAEADDGPADVGRVRSDFFWRPRPASYILGRRWLWRRWLCPLW